jgi:hypothetical protein
MKFFSLNKGDQCHKMGWLNPDRTRLKNAKDALF